MPLKAEIILSLIYMSADYFIWVIGRVAAPTIPGSSRRACSKRTDCILECIIER